MNKNISKTLVFMVVLTIISKALGFTRELILAALFGTNFIVDAYIMANTILNTVFGGIIIALGTAYMPIYSDICEGKGQEEADRFTSHIINLLIVITIFVSFVGIAFSDQITAVFASGFKGETARLTSYFIKVIFFYIIFSSIAGIFEAYLQYRGSFIEPIISGYAISICMSVGIIISWKTSYYYLAFGTVIGYALRCVILWWIAKSKNFIYTRGIASKQTLIIILKMAVPIFIGSYLNYINIFIDKTLAASLSEGRISALNYSSLLYMMIINVTTTVICTVIYPKLSKLNTLNNRHEFIQLANKGIKVICILGIPISFISIVFAQPIIKIVYERGAFDTAATYITASAFMYYSIGMIFIAINEFLVKIYYAQKDMRTPMFLGAISVIINIISNFILVKYMEHNGLALSTSLSAIVNFILLIIFLRKKDKEFISNSFILSFIKIVISAVIFILTAYYSYLFIASVHNVISGIIILRLAISILVSGIIYIFLLDRLKILNVKLFFH